MKERDNVRPIDGGHCKYEISDDPEYQALLQRQPSKFTALFVSFVLGAIAGGLGVYYLSR